MCVCGDKKSSSSYRRLINDVIFQQAGISVYYHRSEAVVDNKKKPSPSQPLRLLQSNHTGEDRDMYNVCIEGRRERLQDDKMMVKMEMIKIHVNRKEESNAITRERARD